MNYQSLQQHQKQKQQLKNHPDNLSSKSTQDAFFNDQCYENLNQQHLFETSYQLTSSVTTFNNEDKILITSKEDVFEPSYKKNQTFYIQFSMPLRYFRHHLNSLDFNKDDYSITIRSKSKINKTSYDLLNLERLNQQNVVEKRSRKIPTTSWLTQ